MRLDELSQYLPLPVYLAYPPAMKPYAEAIASACEQIGLTVMLRSGQAEDDAAPVFLEIFEANAVVVLTHQLSDIEDQHFSYLVTLPELALTDFPNRSPAWALP